MAEEEQIVSRGSHPEEGNPKNNDERMERLKNKRKKRLLKETANAEEKEVVSRESSPKEFPEANNDGRAESRKNKRKKQNLKEAAEGEEELEVNRMSCLKEGKSESNDERVDTRKNKRKKRLLKEAADANKHGICYLSRIPPHMDPLKLRQILSQYGEIQRIYLTPEDPAPRVHRRRERKQDGKFKEQGFSEGWVEFTKKSVAKRVANMLNSEQIGGRKRSAFYYDLWNIKYLSKFKWDDLTEEIAYKNASREQKLALEISAAKRERDFYLSKVDRSRALGFIEERLKEKQKVQQESGTNSGLPVIQQSLKVIRQFPQTKPVADNAVQSKPQLSKDILAGVFGGSY